jgi:hypothetical protein
LNLEIEKLQSLKDNIIERQNKLKIKLANYENFKSNLEQVINEKAIKSEIRETDTYFQRFR